MLEYTQKPRLRTHSPEAIKMPKEARFLESRSNNHCLTVRTDDLTGALMSTMQTFLRQVLEVAMPLAERPLTATVSKG